jgi:molybdopterin/thiamine biosynthesis adenylyltransferase
LATKIVTRELSRQASRPQVIIVGMGGLGCPVAELLALSSACDLVLCDSDIVDRSNLPRQWLYEASDAGQPKTQVAKRVLELLAKDLRIETRESWRPGDSLDAALVIEGTDDVDVKFALSDAAAAEGVPLVTGGVIGTRGFVLARNHAPEPCLRCIFEGPSEETRRTCRDAGVLSPLTHVVGSVMAAAAMRILSEGSESSFWSIDLSEGRARLSQWPRRDDCRACGARA